MSLFVVVLSLRMLYLYAYLNSTCFYVCAHISNGIFSHAREETHCATNHQSNLLQRIISHSNHLSCWSHNRTKEKHQLINPKTQNHLFCLVPFRLVQKNQEQQWVCWIWRSTSRSTARTTATPWTWRSTRSSCGLSSSRAKWSYTSPHPSWPP